MNVFKATTDTDQRLLEGIAKADTSAIQRVYDLTLPTVIRWIQENSGSETDARDVFQEGMMALFQKLQKDNLTLTCTLKSYLQIICRNLWLTRLKKNKKTELTPMNTGEEVSLEDDLIQILERSEKRKLFFKHFDNLEVKCRTILHLFFDKIPMAEIAERLDTTTGYIKKRKFICKSSLIKAIQSDPLFKELTE
ncbi:MAG: RNA polymerase sigma factor [Saprospiraceae bacterium]